MKRHMCGHQWLKLVLLISCFVLIYNGQSLQSKAVSNLQVAGTLQVETIFESNCHVDILINGNETNSTIEEDAQVIIYGNRDETCSLWINPSFGASFLLQILHGKLQETDYLYVEKPSNSNTCGSNVVSLREHEGPCPVAIYSTQIHLHILGQVQLQLHAVSGNHSNTSCANFDLQDRIKTPASNQSAASCSSLQNFDYAVKCNHNHNSPALCNIKCQLGCLCTLQDRRIDSECTTGNHTQHRQGLLIFEKGISELYLLKQNISSLTSDCFQNIAHGLYSLYLSHNLLTSLTPGTFDNMRHLSRLMLGFNNLETLTRSTFHGLESLAILDLQHNRIKTLERSTFSELKPLWVLQLTDNSIENIQEAFQGLFNLNTLNLTKNKFTDLGIGNFQDATQLSALFLAHNRLSSLKRGCFSGLLNLNLLDLSNNRLQDLTTGVFTDIANVTWLDVSNNQLTVIEPGTFAGLLYLLEIFLQGNDLVTIQDGVFYGESLITTLPLNQSNTTNLVTQTSNTDLTELFVLNLSNNALQSLSFLPEITSPYVEILLQGNQIHQVEHTYVR